MSVSIGMFRIEKYGHPAGPSWRALVRIAWEAPLWALPFAAFFGMVYGARPSAFTAAYTISLTFAGIVLLCLWALRSYGFPRLMRWHALAPPSVLTVTALYALTCMLGSLLAAVVVHLYIRPGFIGSVRQIVVWGMFSTIFIALITSTSMARRYHRTSMDQARMQKELELVREIQQSFQPVIPLSPGFDLHAVNVPSRTVSGDFFDVVPVGPALLLAIADVEGKSIPAAVLMATLQASLRTQAQSVSSLATIVRDINVLLCRRGGLQRFASFFLARLDDGGRQLTYCNAGHNPPILLRGTGAVGLLDTGGMMLGVLEEATFEEAVLPLGPGDRLVCYTDGIVETADTTGEPFQLERLIAVVKSAPATYSAQQVTTLITEALRAFSNGMEAEDDRTLLVVTTRTAPRVAMATTSATHST